MLSLKPSRANERNCKFDDEFEIANMNHASTRGTKNMLFWSVRCLERVHIKMHPVGVPRKQSVTVHWI